MGSLFAAVSSLATADSPREPARAAGWAALARRGLSANTLVALALAAGLLAEAFVTTGGVALRANTWAEIVLTFVGAALCAAALLYSAHGQIWGGAALVLFGALTALTLASIAWSVQPADSWVATNQTISYLAAFAGALALARLVPNRWPALIGAVALVATVLSGYALLLKVYPATLDPGEVLGRLRAPFDYWNAVGLAAALGLPACLWAGARRDGGVVLRALTVPAIAVLLVTLVLSYSRGALIAAGAGLVLWFAVVPLRLRGFLVLALGATGGAAVTLWALDTHPITHDLATLRARTSAGHSFGVVLLLMVVLLAGAGVAAMFALDQARLSRQLRRRAGAVLLALAACVPIAGVAVLAGSSRGLSGEISHITDTLTSTKVAGPSDSAGRLVQVSNSRARYWSEGLKVGKHHLLGGVGALGYGTARTQYSRDRRIADHAHSYVIETFADFGLLGIGVSLALLVAWALATGRTLGDAVARRGGAARRGSTARSPSSGVAREHAAERAGLLTALVVVLVFGLHSAIDWTWFIPGVTVPALICAGWLAGRGPPGRVDTRSSPPLRLAGARLHEVQPLRLAGVAAITALALVCAWMIWQPLRSDDADQASLNALATGHPKLALNEANAAFERDPVSVEPLWNLAAIYGTLGRRTTAEAELVKAVRLQPSNASTWLQLAEFDLQLGRPRAALPVLEAALYLDPFFPETLSAVAQARAQLQQQKTATAQRTGRH